MGELSMAVTTHELLLRRHSELLQTYRQQSDLFIKSVITYFAAVGAALGFYFRDAQASDSLQTYLLAFIVVASALCLTGAVAGTIWVREVQRGLDSLDGQLPRGENGSPLPRISLSGGLVLGSICCLAAVIIGAFAIVLLIQR